MARGARWPYTTASLSLSFSLVASRARVILHTTLALAFGVSFGTLS